LIPVKSLCFKRFHCYNPDTRTLFVFPEERFAHSPEARKNCHLTAPPPFCQHFRMLGENKSRFSLTRAALGALRRAKSRFLLLLAASPLLLACLSCPAVDPVVVGTWPGYGRGAPKAFIVQGSFAYIITESGNLHVLDVANPAAPIQVGGAEMGPGYHTGIAANGTHLYVSGYPGLQIFDVTNPAAPVWIGTYETNQGSSAVTSAGSFIFLSSDGGRVDLLDISTPTAPVKVGTCSSSNAKGVAVSGDLLFVAAGPTGLQVFNISDPSNPTLLGSCDTPGLATSVAFKGPYAYLCDGSMGLQVIDVSIPSDPLLVGGFNSGGSDLGIALQDDYIYIADAAAGLQVLSLADPANPAPVRNYPLGEEPRAVAVAGQRAYLIGAETGFHVLNITNPAAPARLGGFDTSRKSWGVALSWPYAYVADGDAGLQILDISNPASPVLAGHLDTSGYAYDVAVAGNHAYVADGSAGLAVIEVSTPSAPALVGTHATQGEALGLKVVGNQAYVANSGGGFLIVNVQDPGAPVEKGRVDTGGYPNDVAVSGTNAYVTDYFELQVIDINNPSAPALLGRLDNTRGLPNAIAVLGRLGLVADMPDNSTPGEGLVLVDLTNRWAPARLATYETAGRFTVGVAAAGTTAYALDKKTGLEMIDISNPALPYKTGACDTPGNPWRLVVSSNYAYVADGEYGLQIIQVAEIPPRITLQPIGQEAYTGSNITFTAGVNGNTPLSYRWQKNGTNLVNGGRISGATTIRLSISNIQLSDAGVYRLAVSNAFGSAFTSNVVLTVNQVLPLSEALDADGLTWQTGGDALWIGQVSHNHDGIDGAQVMLQANNQSWLETTVTGPGKLTFWLRCPGATDSLTLEVDGSTALVGINDPVWQHLSVPVAGGTHTLRWVYSAGSSPNGGAFLDQVQFGAAVPSPFLISTKTNQVGFGSFGLIDASGPQLLTTSGAGLAVFDMSDPFAPAMLCTTSLVFWTIDDFCLDSKRMYACDFGVGLRVVDLTQAATPLLLGTYTNAAVWSRPTVKAGNGYAYVTDLGAVDIVDVRDPIRPIKAGRYKDVDARALALSGACAYVAANMDGLLVLSLADPANPRRIGGYQLPSPGPKARAVEVSGTFVYLLDSTYGFQVFDVSTPSKPRLKGSYGKGQVFQKVFPGRGCVYVIDGEGNIVIIDITDPSAPTWADEWYIPAGARDLAVVGDFVFVADNAGALWSFYHVLPRTGPPEVINQPLSRSVQAFSNATFGVFATGSKPLRYQWLKDGVPITSGGTRIDSTNSSLVITNVKGLDAGVYAVVVSNSAGWVISSNASLHVTPPAGPLWIGGCDTSGSAERVAVSGDYAYVVDGAGGMQVISVSDPTTPVIVGQYAGSAVNSVAVQGTRAFLTSPARKLIVLDITDPTQPVELGSAYSILPKRVAAAGGYAYVADSLDGLEVFDVSTPTAPTRLGAYKTNASDVAIAGNYAFLAVGNWGLQIIDLTSPATPRCVAGLPVAGLSTLKVSGNYAYLLAGSPGLQIVDVSDPTNPRWVGGSEVTRSGYGLSISAGFAFVAEPASGVQVFDVRNPAAPLSVTGFGTPGSAADVVTDDEYAYVADSSAGLSIVRLTSAPKLSVQRLPASRIRIRMHSAPNFLVGLQSSTNLHAPSAWTTPAIFTNLTGIVTVTNQIGNERQQFFRLRLLP
jgi:hypothetical protein